MKPNDPAYWLLDAPKHYSIPKVYLESCYICRDPEFMLMGMPLCRICCVCKKLKENLSTDVPINPKAPQALVVVPGYGHIPADGSACDFCKHECDPGDPECDYYDGEAR